MKKGLLGLLAIALTVVGCQNYDDQFDELNDKILSLSQSISELDGIRTEVTALGTKLDQLASTSASASDLAAVMAEVAALTATMAEIKDDVSYGEEEVDDLEQEIDDIKAALNELLQQASIIQQDIVIMSTAQLEYVENLMGLDPAEDNTFVAEESREYIVSGNITVDAEFVEDAAIATRLNNVLARIASVIIPSDGSGVTLDSGSSATKGTALTLTSMAFVDGTISLEGANAIDASTLAALTATLTLKQGGAIAFAALNQVGDVRIAPAAGAATITSVNFSQVTTGGQISTAAGQLVSAAMSGDVDLGKLDLPPLVTLGEISSLKAGGAPNGVVISALKATSIDLMDTTAFAVTGSVSITAKGAISVNAKSITGSLYVKSTAGAIALADLTSAGLTTLSASETIVAGITGNASGTTATGAAVHFASLASNAAALTITAAEVDLSALASNAVTATINTCTNIALGALTSAGGNIVAPDATTFAAPLLNTSTGTIDVKTGAAITLKNLSTTTTTLLDFDNLVTLTLLEQGTNLDFSDASSMTTLNYTGKLLYSDAMDQQTNSVTITGMPLLANINIGDGYIGNLHINGAGVTELTTQGKIVNVQVANNTALTDISFGHDHLSGERAATVLVSSNPKIESLDLSTINKIKTVNVSGNVSLTSLTMAGYSPPAEPGAAINVTISGNALTADYDTAVAGSETTPYSDASLSDSTGLLCSISEFINFYDNQADRTATPTLSLNIAKVTNDAATPVTATLSDTLSGDTAAKAGLDGVAGGADAETDGGAIDSIAEMTAIIDTCS